LPFLEIIASSGFEFWGKPSIEATRRMPVCAKLWHYEAMAADQVRELHKRQNHAFWEDKRLK